MESHVVFRTLKGRSTRAKRKQTSTSDYTALRPFSPSLYDEDMTRAVVTETMIYVV